jgi:hypothetical protein
MIFPKKGHNSQQIENFWNELIILKLIALAELE